MNLFTSTNQLLLFFTQHDSFCFNEHYKELIKEAKNINPAEIEASIMSALKDLQTSKIIELYQDKPDKPLTECIWVLRRPLDTYQQTVSLNQQAAVQISSVINNFIELTGDDSERSNPMQLSERDINNLLQICSLLIERLGELEEAQENKKSKKNKN